MKNIATILALVAGLAGASTLSLADTPVQPPAPPSQAGPALAPPAAADLETVAVELADTAMRTFVEGIRQKDFRVLGSIASLNFRKSYSPEQVNEAFKQFFTVTITGDPLAGKSPIFLKAPAIGRDRRLEIEGLYELADGLLLFQLAYVREGTGWKLDGLNVRSKPYNTSTPNPASTEKPLKFKIPAGKLVEA